MTITARPYRDLRDLKEMQAVLTTGRLADNHAYYVHPGDLSWWLFYTDEKDLDTKICLWEWNSSLAGWSMLSPSSRTFDVFVRPELHGRSLEARILLWAEETQALNLRGLHGSSIRTMWVAESDRHRIQWLEMRGFRPCQQGILHMQRSLRSEFPTPLMPEGFHIRAVSGEREVDKRAEVSFAAFASTRTIENYRQRMLRFMRSPVYQPAQDLVTVSPDGRFASFCLLWTDPVNRVGLFEPVGTHPDFQGKGLARAVLCAGLNRLRDLNMTTASVCVETDNLPAIHLYESMGFRTTLRLLTYEKSLLLQQ